MSILFKFYLFCPLILMFQAEALREGKAIPVLYLFCFQKDTLLFASAIMLPVYQPIGRNRNPCLIFILFPPVEMDFSRCRSRAPASPADRDKSIGTGNKINIRQVIPYFGQFINIFILLIIIYIYYNKYT